VPPGYREEAGERVLRRMIAQFDTLAGEVAVKRSGGARRAGIQMLHAAFAAYDLFAVGRGRVPTLTRDGDYLQLTSILYELATGRTRDPERACRRFIRQIVRGDRTAGTDALDVLIDRDHVPPEDKWW
jgi:hypothetical protein